jgi:hypothetical protein
VYNARRYITDKVAGSVIDEAEGGELHLGYAREDRSALWLPAAGREPGVQGSPILADGNYLHTRYYGSGKQEDFRV